MATFVLDCPHCPARSMTFTMIGFNPMTEAATNRATTFFMLMKCGGCGRCVVCEFGVRNAENPDLPSRVPLDLGSGGFMLRQYWPQPKTTDAPAHVPDNIARFYKQAAAALGRGDWDAAGMMARKALDAATFKVDPDLARGSKLVKRIDALAASHRITPQLQEWAHAIREDGNDAAHDPDEFTESEAKEVCEFTETFLEYVFTMPGKLAARKAEFETAKSEGA